MKTLKGHGKIASLPEGARIMTDKERVEEVREAGARELLRIIKLMSPMKAATFSAYKKQFDQLRKNIKGKDGKPMLGIIDLDQSRPKNLLEGKIVEGSSGYETGWHCGFDVCLKKFAANFRRVIIEEE